MTTLPAIPEVIIRFGGGAIFEDSLVLGSLTDGLLGTNVLGAFQTVQVPKVQQVSIRRGRTDIDQDFGAGSATVSFLDFNGDWNPQNLTGPYFGELVPGRQLQIRAVSSGVGYNLFAGYITSYDLTYDIGSPVARVTVEAVDALRLLTLAAIDTVAGTAAGDLPGERLNDILDAVSWPQSARNIQLGSVTLQDDPGGVRAVLSAMRNVEASELGGLFIDASGRVVFLSRQGLAEAAIATPLRFSDQGVDLPYQSLDFVLDDVEILNDVTVQREGGTAQTVTDSASVTKYFARSQQRTGLLMETDDRALQQANMIVNNRKEPKLLLRSLSFDVVDQARLLAALTVEFGDSVEVVREHVPGSTVTLLSTVQGINHDIDAQRWVTSLSTADALAYAFVLGSSQFGVLGFNIL
jgi:hypothetical protein